MDTQTLSMLIQGVFFFILGAVVIGAIWYFQTIGKHATQKDNGASPTDPDLSEVARLMRDRKTQDLAVIMDGKAYKSAQELTPALNHRLNFTSRVLIDWLAKTPQAEAPEPIEPPANIGTEPPASITNEPPVPVTTPAEEPATPLEPKPAVVEPVLGETASEVKPVSTNLQDVLSGIINPAPKPAPVFKSIASQINDLLQARIAGTPFETRGITIKDAPDHSVIVTLDGQNYPGVSDVPDAQVREFIHGVVDEWETTAKPGVM